MFEIVLFCPEIPPNTGSIMRLCVMRREMELSPFPDAGDLPRIHRARQKTRPILHQLRALR